MISTRPMEAKKPALITGIRGQDGSHLAELLLEKGGVPVIYRAWSPSVTLLSIPRTVAARSRDSGTKSNIVASGVVIRSIIQGQTGAALRS